MRRNTHAPAPDGGGEVFDTTIEAPIIIRDPEKNSQMARMCLPQWRTAKADCGGLRSRSTTRTTPRTRLSASHPAGGARSDRADGFAAIFDHYFGRAAQQGNQLSDRVRRGAERSAPGWFPDAKARGQPRREADSPARPTTRSASFPFSSATRTFQLPARSEAGPQCSDSGKHDNVADRDIRWARQHPQAGRYIPQNAALRAIRRGGRSPPDPSCPIAH